MRLLIYKACHTGNKNLLKKLTKIVSSRLLDIKNDSGKTPLMIAVLQNHIDCVRILLKAGVNVDGFDSSGRTALHFASKKGFHRCIKLLLSYHASYELNDYSGNTPLHFAAINKNSKCLQAFLKVLKPAEIDIQDSLKRTALHWCSAYCYPLHIEMLLSKGANVGVPDFEGKIPLHYVAANNNARAVECMTLLLETQRTAINWQDYEGRSPLHLAVGTGSIHVVNFLVSKYTCDTDIYDNKFCTPLHWAARSNLSEQTDLLLKKCLYTTPDNNGATPLHYAAFYDHVKVLQTFLSRTYIYDVNDFKGRNTFMWAVANGSDDAVNILIKRGTDLNVVDKEGMTALHIAAANSHLSTIKLLVKHNVPIDSKNNEEEITPLIKACRHGRVRSAMILIELGANKNAVDINSRSALHWSAIDGNAYLCQMLLLKGVQCNIKDDFGRTPLHYACMKKRYLNCVSVLLESGARVNVMDDEGKFPLHYAILADHAGIVKLLCRYEAYLNIMTRKRDWISPLDIAFKKGYPEIKDVLIAYGALRTKEIKEIAALKIQEWYRYNRDLKIKYFQQKREAYKKLKMMSAAKHSKIPVFTKNVKDINKMSGRVLERCMSCTPKYDEEQAANVIIRAWKSYSIKAKISKMQKTVQKAFDTFERRVNAEDLFQKRLQSFCEHL